MPPVRAAGVVWLELFTLLFLKELKLLVLLGGDGGFLETVEPVLVGVPPEVVVGGLWLAPPWLFLNCASSCASRCSCSRWYADWASGSLPGYIDGGGGPSWSGAGWPAATCRWFRSAAGSVSGPTPAAG